MTFTVNAKTIQLDTDETDLLVSDLADLSTEIDEMLTTEDKQAKLQALLTKLNTLADIYT